MNSQTHPSTDLTDLKTILDLPNNLYHKVSNSETQEDWHQTKEPHPQMLAVRRLLVLKSRHTTLA